MKRSELKSLIQEAVREELNEGPNDSSWKDAYSELNKAILLISSAKRKYESMQVDYNKAVAESLRKAYNICSDAGTTFMKYHG